MTAARYWALSFVATAAAVVASYLWLDRPVALIVHAHVQQYRLFEKLTYLPGGISVLAIAGAAVLGLHGLRHRSLSKLPTVLLLCIISLVLTATIKDRLKFAFGRPWPETWTRRNLSFIHDNVFGFFPFHGGPGYESFPSGHTAAICSVMSVLWICYPRFRTVYALCILAVGIGLIGANFHFVSDVIAGAFLGSFVGWLSVTVWESGVRPLRPPAASQTTEVPQAGKGC